MAHSGLDFISVALDGAKEKTYQKYRKKGDFNQVIRNIQLLIKERKKTPLIKIQFLVMKGNEYEIGNVKRLAKNLKVDRLTLKAVITHNKVYDKKFQPIDNRYRLQLSKNIKCTYPFSRPVVAWNGLIFPCCSTISLNKKHSSDNIFEKRFKDIWFTGEYQNFRRTVFKKSESIKKCRNCIFVS